MSVTVELDALADAVAEHGRVAYVLSVGPDRPHVLHAALEWVDGTLACAVSRTLSANVAERPGVTLLWPPTQPGAMSLVVDGVARCEGDRIVIEPVSAILHVARS
jgi:hypothetical protein